MRRKKSALRLIIIGLIGMVVGVTFKLNHFMGAERIFNVGAFALVVGLIFWLISLSQENKK